MSTIQDLFQQAQLAEAAYANFAAFPNNDIGEYWGIIGDRPRLFSNMPVQ